jgi:hypothetical protein
MNRLSKIVRSAMPGTGMQFCKTAYGTDGIHRFLRDVISLANASVSGNRYIVTGVEFDEKGQKRIQPINRDDFAGNPPYQALVADFIEPPVRITYQHVSLEGKRVGVYEIGDCRDRPYMMRIDHSERLRRGDAYIRMNETAVKMGRRQLQELFAKKFREAVPADNIEIGFPGEIIHKDLHIETADLSQLPSTLANAKLMQLMEIREKVKDSGSTTVMARLTHARLFGSDSPYEDRNSEELAAEMSQIQHKHENGDRHYLFEEKAKNLQLVILNQGEDPIEDAALTLVMPNHAAFYVANQLPKRPKDGAFVERSAAEMSTYPSVNLKEDAVHVSNNLGEIPTGALVQVFKTPLRICVGSDLRGRKLGIRYSLFGSNLQRPAQGKLRLLF